jgi:lipoprotein-anchoring transpeptidase ErfK/SrfK
MDGSRRQKLPGSSLPENPWTIGQSVSSGCIRMINQDVVDLYQKTPIGTRVVVLTPQARS